jgi:hypothetical protein
MYHRRLTQQPMYHRIADCTQANYLPPDEMDQDLKKKLWGKKEVGSLPHMQPLD